MAKYKFPFENVIKHRKTLEEIAQTNFQSQLAELNTEIKRLEEMVSTYSLAFQQRHELELKGGPAGGPLKQVQDFLAGQDIRMDRQKKKISEVENRVEELRDILRERAIDTKIIKELKEKRRRAFDLVQRKKEASVLDDLNLMRFRLKRDEHG